MGRVTEILTTDLAGDLRVGNDLVVDESLNIGGDAKIHGNVRVEGWLDAPNLVGLIKGAFSSVARLREVYPVPEEGWVAFIGTEWPWRIWRAEYDEDQRRVVWVDTFNDASLNVYAELTDELTASVSGLTDWKAGLGEVVEDVWVERNESYVILEETMRNLKTGATRIIRRYIQPAGVMAGVMTKEQARQLAALWSFLDTDLGYLPGTRFALIDPSGKISASVVPEEFDDVQTFVSVVDIESPQQSARAQARCHLCWNERENEFVWRLVNMNATIYYSDWEGHPKPKPHEDVLYLTTGTLKMYMYTGGEMQELQPGNEEYESRIFDLEGTVDKLERTVDKLERAVAALVEKVRALESGQSGPTPGVPGTSEKA